MSGRKSGRKRVVRAHPAKMRPMTPAPVRSTKKALKRPSTLVPKPKPARHVKKPLMERYPRILGRLAPLDERIHFTSPSRYLPGGGALALLLVALIILLTSGGGIPANAVARVGGTAVSKATFNHWMTITADSTGVPVPVPPKYTTCIALKQLTTAKGKTPPTHALAESECASQYQTLKSQALGFLLSSEWTIREAAAQGVFISDKAVKAQFLQEKNAQFSAPGSFQKFLATSGETVSDILLRIKVQLLSTKIEAKIKAGAGHVTAAEIAAYYNNNPTSYNTPPKRTLKIILTNTQAQALAAKKAISSGISWGREAKKVSIDPDTKNKGGVFTATQGQDELALDNAVFSAHQGVITGPVSTPFGYYIFVVTGATPAYHQTLAQASASIRQQLTTSRPNSVWTAFTTAFAKKYKAQTICRTGFVVEDCSEFKGTTSSSNGTAPTQGSTPSQPVTPAPVTSAPKVVAPKPKKK